LSPNACAHADLLVERFGLHRALELVRFYARDYPAGGYWSDVLASLTVQPPAAERGRDTGSSVAPRGARLLTAQRRQAG